MHTRIAHRLLPFALLLSPLPAAAESGLPPCTQGRILPSASTVPANLSSFVLDGYSDWSGPRRAPSITLTQTGPAGEEPRSLDIAPFDAPSERWRLTPVAPLEPGGQYTFTDSSCGSSWTSPFLTVYAVTDPVEPPVELGVTTVSPLRASRYSPGEPLHYFVDVTFEPTEEALAAATLYEMVTTQAGLPVLDWRSITPYSQSVSIPCSETAGATTSQTFQHRARPIGSGEATLFTEPVAIRFVCDEAVRVDPRDGHPLSPSEIEAMDRMDAGVPRPDGGGDPFMDGGTPDGSTMPDVSGVEPVTGCTCRAASSRGGAGGGLALGLALALLLRRRRRGGASHPAGPC